LLGSLRRFARSIDPERDLDPIAARLDSSGKLFVISAIVRA
jgi:hypothetical protein